MQCPRCQQNNPVPDALFCPRCGTATKQAQGTAAAVSYADLQRELAEAREQQIATSEILRVISQSPRDVQPVFDTIAHNAARLCHGANAAVFRTDGRTIEHPAHYGAAPDAYAEVVRQYYPMRLTRWTQQGQAMLERSVVYLEDSEAASTPPLLREVARRLGFRSQVTIPMLRDEQPVGAITVARAQPGRFTDSDIALLKTFADQAVIAIENVRLFNETKEALEQQTATSEILRVISSSPTDVQPVFDAICRSAVRLCGAYGGLITSFDGTLVHLAAVLSSSPDADERVRREYPRGPDAAAARDRAILERAVINIPDTDADSEYTRQVAREFGYRRLLYVPMLRDGQPIGSIGVSGREPGPYTEQQIELLKMFADQAVIAIENVRLFKELEARTPDLTRSVGELLALGEVGQAISSTLDLETVLTTIVARAVQLSGLDGGVVFEYDEAAEEFVQRAMTDTGEALAEARRSTRIRKGEGVLGRTAITLEAVQVADIALPGAYEGRLREILIDSGIRAILAVPMVREDQLIGCLAVTRNQPVDFPTETIDLLRTFATQSA